MFTLEQVVPWGRSFDEYCQMFALGDDDLSRRILGCGDGPASFNAEATRRGSQVVSCDPIYRLQPQQIRERIETTYQEIIEQTRRNMNEFVWTSIRSIDELGRVRIASEVRIFPLLALGGQRSALVDTLASELTDLDFDVAIDKVPYEFQRGGNQMMRIRRHHAK